MLSLRTVLVSTAVALAIAPASATASNPLQIAVEPAATFEFPFDYSVDRRVRVTNVSGRRLVVNYDINSRGLQDAIVMPQWHVFALEPGESRALEITGAVPNDLRRVGEQRQAVVTLTFGSRDRAASQHAPGEPDPVVVQELTVASTVRNLGDRARANSTIAGRVTRAGRPVVRAVVTASPGRRSTRTDGKGRYSLPVHAHRFTFFDAPRPYTVTVRKPGVGVRAGIAEPRPGKRSRLDFAFRPVRRLSYRLAAKHDTGLAVNRGEVSRDGRLIAMTPFHSGMPDDFVRSRAHLDVLAPTGELLWRYPLQTEVMSVDVAADGSRIAVPLPNPDKNGPPPVPGSHPKGSIGVFDSAGTMVRRIPMRHDLENLLMPEQEPSEVRFSPDGRRLAYGTVNGNVVVADLATGETIFQRYVVGQVRYIFWSADGSRLFASSGDGFVYAYSATGQLLWKRDIRGWSLAADISKNYLLVGSKAGRGIYALRQSDGTPLFQYPVTARPDAAAISPDESRFVYLNSSNGTLRSAVFDKRGRPLWALPDTFAGQAAAWTADSRYVVMSGTTTGHGNGVTLVVLADRDGNVLWQTRMVDRSAWGAGPNGFAYIAPDLSRIVIGSENSGRVYAFERR